MSGSSCADAIRDLRAAGAVVNKRGSGYRLAEGFVACEDLLQIALSAGLISGQSAALLRALHAMDD